MIRIQLPEGEAQRVEELFRSTDDRKLRDRLQIVLLAHKGRPRGQIASDLAIHRRSVTRWLNAYCDGGLDALVPRKPKGKAASIPDHLADEIKAWVMAGPVSQGIDRANWTHEELADHLRKTHGIGASRSSMQRFCSRIDIRPYRPTYRFLRADKAKQEAAKEDLAALKKSAGGRAGAAEPGRGAFPDGPNPGGNAGRQGAPAGGRHARLQGRVVRVRRHESGLGGAARQHAGEPPEAEPQERGQ